MTTVRNICTRAIRRLRIVDATEQPDAADIALALDALNDMIFSWEARNIRFLLQREFVLNDEFVHWVPPAETGFETINVASLIGDWDADQNDPPLQTGQGEPGQVYRVSVAGNTLLDGVSDWQVNDFLVFDAGLVRTDIINAGLWRKGLSSRRFENGIHALLAMRIAPEFGIEPRGLTARDAKDGYVALNAAFVKPPTRDIFDSTIFRTPSSRYQDYISSG